ncbi:hypothetical protein [Algoriphagus sp. CAU 1675]|uniref:hypothetical protein n=1 Tax=Algoriphagus sp. CAU 1675 TaxID=3032597 RepID=UPI0023DB7F7D|nr:hypothetical protein [Algoriphagus sp. CAU 1675]MDF2156461.1 hypothetical protein [Algoriphagus sp. CAU 1675]
MKKLILLFLIGALPFLAFSQSNKSFWIEIDGIYWEKSLGNQQYIGPEKSRFGSIRPMIGWNLKNSWAIGLMGNYQSYLEQQQDLKIYNPIYFYPEETPEFPQIISYSEANAKTGMSNEFFGWGVFLRKSIQLGEKTSLNLNFYGMRESGKNGNFEIYSFTYFYPFLPCLNCLTINPGPLQAPMEEKNWRFGLDLAFAWQLKPWMDLGVRANFLEFRKRSLIDPRGQITNIMYEPIYDASRSLYGDRYDFGSALSREGIRLSLTFKPF